jgi:hypothetical protein
MAARLHLIEELTKGIHLPLAALHSEHLSVISEVLSIAWDGLMQTSKGILLTASEPELNALMVTRLNALLDSHQMWRQLVRSVTRGTESESFDGTHLEKRPDLSIHLTYRNPSFPLAIECKLIDASVRQDEGRYCKQGLAKFLKGEYAWATQEAFMLAYVRDGSSISSCLTPLLTASESKSPRPYLVEKLPTPVDLLSLDLARSVHGRTFKYPNRIPPNDRPGSIAVWHLWMMPSH